MPWVRFEGGPEHEIFKKRFFEGYRSFGRHAGCRLLSANSPQLLHKLLVPAVHPVEDSYCYGSLFAYLPHAPFFAIYLNVHFAIVIFGAKSMNTPIEYCDGFSFSR